MSGIINQEYIGQAVDGANDSGTPFIGQTAENLGWSEEQIASLKRAFGDNWLEIIRSAA